MPRGNPSGMTAALGADMSKSIPAIPHSRDASRVLPLPGGPTKSKWWAPAAAISSARRACAWPRTSARSGCAAARQATASARGSDLRASSAAHTSSRVRAVRTSTSAASAASLPLAGGTSSLRPARPLASAAASTPSTARISPVNASSPRNSQPSSASPETWPLAASMPRAIARSKRPPCLGRSAGARLMVIRRAGNSNCAQWMAARTRSLASRTAASGSPTMLIDGKPPPRWTSTRTSGACTPTRARLCTIARPMAAAVSAAAGCAQERPARRRTAWRGRVPALRASRGCAPAPRAAPRIPRG